MFNETDDARDSGDDEDNKDDEGDSQLFELASYTWDPERFWEVIVKLDEYSLLQSLSPNIDQEGAKFSLHPLIRDWLQLRLKANKRAKYTQEAILVLRYCAQAYKDHSTTLGERLALIAHMDVSLSNDKGFSEPQDRLGFNIINCKTVERFGYFYSKQGLYRISEALYRRALDTHRSGLSEKHPDTLRIMNGLGGVLRDQGKYREAEGWHRQALSSRETELGNDHSETLASMSDLALVLQFQGKYGEAESICRGSLNSFRITLGIEHPNTLTSMHNLGQLFNDQGRFKEAESMYRQTLTLREKLLGKSHPDTLSSMGCLASTLADQ